MASLVLAMESRSGWLSREFGSYTKDHHDIILQGAAISFSGSLSVLSVRTSSCKAPREHLSHSHCVCSCWENLGQRLEGGLRGMLALGLGEWRLNVKCNTV